MVRLIENRNAGEGIWTDYEFFYSLGSAVAHSSSQSMQEYMRRPFKTSYQEIGRRRPYLCDLPILAPRWCLVTGFQSAEDHYRAADSSPSGYAFIDAFHHLRSLTYDLEGELVERGFGL